MEAGLAYLELVLSQVHDKEFKFSQDNDRGLKMQPLFEKLVRVLERKHYEGKKEVWKVLQNTKEKNLPGSPSPHQGPLVLNVK